MKTKTIYISECDDKEFQSEQACKIHEARYDKNIKRNKNLVNGLTLEMINILAPEHRKSECTDSHLHHGFIEDNDRNLRCRCTRCGLLELYRDKEWFSDFHRIEFDFSFSVFQ